MPKTLGEYDINKLKEARKIIEKVYEYNYTCESDSLGKKLFTIINKIDKIIEKHKKEG